ncbi:hypothetical protein [Streptomyces sp. NPDC040750]
MSLVSAAPVRLSERDRDLDVLRTLVERRTRTSWADSTDFPRDPFALKEH